MNNASAKRETTVAFSINGETHAYTGDPFNRLANVLRDEFGLTGTKIGCEAGDCGACTVLINKEQACGCLVPVVQAQDCYIETVENIQTSELGSALQ